MKDLNRMCLNCLSLNNDCDGTTEKVWTGCVYKITDNPDETGYMEKREEVHKLIDTLSGRKEYYNQFKAV